MTEHLHWRWKWEHRDRTNSCLGLGEDLAHDHVWWSKCRKASGLVQSLMRWWSHRQMLLQPVAVQQPSKPLWSTHKCHSQVSVLEQRALPCWLRLMQPVGEARMNTQTCTVWHSIRWSSRAIGCIVAGGTSWCRDRHFERFAMEMRVRTWPESERWWVPSNLSKDKWLRKYTSSLASDAYFDLTVELVLSVDR